MATARVPQPTADDPVKVDPKHYTVEFENDRVRVVHIKYKPGEKSVMHSHPESVAVFLTDAHGSAHGRLYPLAGKHQQSGIRGHSNRVEGLVVTSRRLGARAKVLSLSWFMLSTTSHAKAHPSQT